MSKAEILAELPRLTAEERGEILDHLWSMEEAAGPARIEMTLLDEAQSRFDADPAAETPWAEVEARLRRRG